MEPWELLVELQELERARRQLEALELVISERELLPDVKLETAGEHVSVSHRGVL